MKKTLFSIAIICICVFLFSISEIPAFAMQNNIETAVFDGVNMYSECNFSSEIIAKINTDDTVVVLETFQDVDGRIWKKVEKKDAIGYVLSCYLCTTPTDKSAEIRKGVITTDKQRSEIFLYKECTEESEIIKKINDGTKVEIIGSSINGFYKIYTGDETGFVKESSISFGLSFYQNTALIIGLICLVAVSIILVLLFIVKNKKILKK